MTSFKIEVARDMSKRNVVTRTFEFKFYIIFFPTQIFTVKVSPVANLNFSKA